tara:strand:+ start:2878 stop:4701 length:1824 start_codon:yes stop_codon:yes gene_type:complete
MQTTNQTTSSAAASSIMSSIDNYNPKSVGENGHVQHSVSNNAIEQIYQFYFQLVRTKDTSNLSTMLRNILIQMRNKQFLQSNFNHLVNLYKMIGNTRDIVSGKGEQQLTFMQIWEWYHFNPTLSFMAVNSLFHLNSINGEQLHPYGSWKDVKYLCNYVKEKVSTNTNTNYNALAQHPIIDFVTTLMVNQLRIDLQNYRENKPIQLTARWAPREPNYKKKKNIKFGWIYFILAKKFYSSFLESASTQEEYQKASKKCYTHFRKLLSSLNTYLKTLQIYQTSGNWSEINFNNVTSCSMRKQRKAFGNHKNIDSEDRKTCADNFKAYVETCKADPERNTMKGKRLFAYELVKDCFEHGLNQQQIDVINLQWESNKSNNSNLGKMIAFCDSSYSMESDNCIPLFNSLGLSIRISELCHPLFRDRVMIFACEPKWVKLDCYSSFYEKAVALRNTGGSCGISTNFYRAMHQILRAFVENNVNPQEVEDLVLALFSDMQINVADKNFNDTLYDNIKRDFAEAGLSSSWGVPYNPPHILFWNLRETKGFPTVTSKENVTMLSGFSSSLLNVFEKKGIAELKKMTPRTMIETILNNDRYDQLESNIIDTFQVVNSL